MTALALRPCPVEAFNARARRERWPVVCCAPPHFDSGALADIAAIWDFVRGDQALPVRSEFSARALGRHMGCITFIDLVWQPAAMTPRYRMGFFGSRLSVYAGDLTGRFVDEAVDAELVPTWYAEFAVAAALLAPVRFVSRVRAFRLDLASAETLLAPLANASGEVGGFVLAAAFSR